MMNAKKGNPKWRESFEQAANIYQQARPDYPEALFDESTGVSKTGSRRRRMDLIWYLLQTVYHELGEGEPVDNNDWPGPGELHEQREEIANSGLFEVVHIRHFDWERVYPVEDYIQLLQTFSGHILMEGWKRDKLFNEIRVRLDRRPDKSVRRHWGAVLHIARRKVLKKG